MSAIILPRICRVQLSGFAPLFDQSVEFSVPDKPGSFLILGGNGLGKTSILQSVVFAIAGIADHDLQDARENSRYKWDMSYFKDRVNEPQNAEILVEFLLGKTRIQVRRGLDNDKVRGVRIDDAEWINSKEAPGVYEQAVIRASRCVCLRDFR